MRPAPVQSVFDLAFQHHQAGQLAAAESLYLQILATQPGHADALHHLGVIAHQTGQPDRAIELIRRALVLNPGNAAAHSNLGEVWRKLGRWDEAVTCYRRALALQPDLPEVHHNLGMALAGQGRFDEASAAFRRTLESQPGHVAARVNLGLALQAQGQNDEAVTAFRHALQLQPGHMIALTNLGNALRDHGQLDEAIAAYRQALQFQLGQAEVHNGLALALAAQGRLDEAIAEHRRARDLNPGHSSMHSNLLYMLHFHPTPDEEAISEERQRWNRQFAEPLKRFIRPHAHDRDPERRLRIGYVSPDFRDHVVGRNLLPLFRHHDREKFEILCYSGVRKPDGLTALFRQCARTWCDVADVGDETLAELIRRDGVDILVDLSQHMADNRLPVFARQPAPVQVSFAGYPEGTGLEAIGHRISDRYLDAHPGEQVVLIDSFWCYEPGGLELPVSPLPAGENSYVTFASLNAFAKVNEAVLQLWGRIMARVKDSRLVLLADPGSHRQRTIEILTREGVDAHRVEFVLRCSRKAYLERYQRLDIVLDPFPYNGHTTSLDALWMGVPVVSLVGPRSVSRAGLSQLSNLGLPELAAFSEEDYLRAATALAHDLPRLAALRSTLRPRMQASALTDAAQFTRNIENSYRTMWQQWCGQQTPSS